MTAPWPNPTWTMVNPHPKGSLAWLRCNMRLAALDWRYWSRINTPDGRRQAKHWLARAVEWRTTAAERPHESSA